MNRSETKGFTDKWFWAEELKTELPHKVLLNDPIQGKCVARFDDAINAQLFCLEQAKWQLERELEFLKAEELADNRT